MKCKMIHQLINIIANSRIENFREQTAVTCNDFERCNFQATLIASNAFFIHSKAASSEPDDNNLFDCDFGAEMV
jgi:hypothetical protein